MATLTDYRQPESHTFFNWTPHAENILKQNITDICRRNGGRGNLTIETWEEESFSVMQATAYYDGKSMLRYTMSISYASDDQEMQKMFCNQAMIVLCQTMMEVGFISKIPGREETMTDFTNLPITGRTRLLDFRC